MHSSFEGRKPEILYPCIWAYQVIGTDETRLRAAVVEVIGDVDHTLESGNVSRGGKYLSLRIQARVEDERQRLEIFDSLSKHPTIRFVL
jgi:putative lipoic acid-binding regulatory protein